MKTLLICDDEKSILEDLSLRLSHILPENWDIKAILVPGDLLTYIDTSAALPDIIFMDIQFGTENGISLASDIQARYPWIAIVLITGYLDYARDIFTIHPAYFLVKPVDTDKLTAAVDRALEYLDSCQDTPVVLQSNGKLFTLKSSEICYIESEKRLLHVYTPKEKFTVYMKLNELKEKLPGCFLTCHKSYMVNMNYIRNFTAQKIRLLNQSEIPVSRSRYKKSREEFLRFFSTEDYS